MGRSKLVLQLHHLSSELLHLVLQLQHSTHPFETEAFGRQPGHDSQRVQVAQ